MTNVPAPQPRYTADLDRPLRVVEDTLLGEIAEVTVRGSEHPTITARTGTKSARADSDRLDTRPAWVQLPMWGGE